MVRLPLPMVIVGVLVALAAKVMLVRPPPGILFLTESMSIVLVLENRGERVSNWSLARLALKKLLLANPQESRGEALVDPVRMWWLLLTVEDPEKIQRVWLELSWLW